MPDSPDNIVKDIADNAEIIIAGFAYTKMDNGNIRVINLERSQKLQT